VDLSVALTASVLLLRRLADRIPAPAQSHRDDSQTEYDLTHPFWTITFRYHTQDMFNALFKSEDEERREEQLARDRKSGMIRSAGRNSLS
jgi:hypothetical protein